VSLGGVNYCLCALVARGLVKMHNFGQSERKLAYGYLLMPVRVTEKAVLAKVFFTA
jgi:hypothetical protein